MTKTNELSNQQQHKPEEPMYTLSEAYKLVKEKYGLMDRDEAYALFSKVYKAFIKIKSDYYASKLYDNYTGEDIKNLDFEDIDIDTFVAVCYDIYDDYTKDSLDIPDDFFDEDAIKEYFKYHLDDFWFDIKNCYFFYSNVVNKYYKTLNLSYIMEYFKI